MATPASLASAIHDAIDGVTTTAERIHLSIAELPLDVLRGIQPIEQAVDQVKSLQGRSISAVYGLVRRINREVEQLAKSALPN